MASSVLGAATGPDKLQAVTELVDKLTKDLEVVSLLPKERNSALEELKIYGRDPTNADPIFTEEGISMLLKHAFHSPSSETSRAAMRALANAMFLKPNTRQIFIDQGFATNACDGLGSGDWDDEFLRSRIVFLSTYGTNVDLSDLIKNHQLAKSIVDNLGKHAKKVSGKKDNVVQSEPMEDMALAETLKLLFNVTHYCREEWGSFTPALPHIITLFWRQDIPEKKPLDSPFGPLVNSLVNFDFDTESAKAVIFPKGQQSKICDRMIELLDKAMKDYRGNDLDGTVTPLVGVMTKLYENAPEEARETMRQNLLPSAADRVSVLGEGDTLSGRLLKNSTNPLAPALRTAISHLQFDLSDRNATKFVENVGYGFASGFLFQNNVPIPTSASEAFSTTDTTGNVRSVNPITGQFWDKEKHPELPEMTDEEKEREAERLFVLFERLKMNGVIDVQNPVEIAAREGKFRELKDDEVEELP